MSKDIAVDPDVLRSHASKVEELAGEVGEAASAAQSVNLGGGAFGLMCSFLVPVISPAATSTGQMIGTSGAVLTRTGTELRAVVTDFSGVEADIVQALHALQSPLD